MERNIQEMMERHRMYKLLIILSSLPYCDKATEGCCEVEFAVVFIIPGIYQSNPNPIKAMRKK